MYIPRVGSRRAEFIEIVNKSGGITVERIVKQYGMLGFPDVWYITSELRKLVRYKCIKNLVPPREPVPFTPLKTFPPTVSPRGQPIERRSFKTCKSNVRYQGKNDL